MKRTQLILLPLLLIAIAYSVLCAYIGHIAARQISTTLPTATQLTTGKSFFALDGYKKGIFSSQATIGVLQKGKIEFLKIDIKHAPLLNAGTNWLRANSDTNRPIHGHAHVTFTGQLIGDAQFAIHLGSNKQYLTAPTVNAHIEQSIYNQTDGSLTIEIPNYTLTNQLNQKTTLATINNARIEVTHNNDIWRITFSAQNATYSGDDLPQSWTLNNAHLEAANSLIDSNNQRWHIHFTGNINNPDLPDYHGIDFKTQWQPLPPLSQLKNPHTLPLILIPKDLIVDASLTLTAPNGNTALTAKLHGQEHITNPLQLTKLKTITDLIPYLNGSNLTLERILPAPTQTTTWKIENDTLYQNGHVYY